MGVRTDSNVGSLGASDVTRVTGSGTQEAIVASLQAEVVRLRRELKQLQLENQNVYWLADEYKRLKAELAAVKGQGNVS